MLQGPVVLSLPGRQAWSPVIDGYTTRRYTDPQTFSTEPVWGGGIDHTSMVFDFIPARRALRNSLSYCRM